MNDSFLKISNNGTDIIDSNYWELPYNEKSAFFVSINGGAIRLLVPDGHRASISEMRKGLKYVVASFLNLDNRDDLKKPALELLFEDNTQTPFNIQLGASQFDRLPDSNKDIGREFKFVVYSREMVRGKYAIKKNFERKCYVQFVPSLPWLKRIE